MLPRLGLDEFGEQVYRAVLRHPDCDASTLAEWITAPAALTEAELGNLLEKGLVRRSAHGWLPVDPEQVLRASHIREEAELVRRRAEMAEERADLYGSGLLGDYLAGRSRAGLSVGLEVITDTVEVFRRIEEWTAQTEDRVRTFVTGAEPPGFTTMYEVWEAAQSKGLSLDSIWTPDALAGTDHRKLAMTRKISAWGAHRADTLAMRCIIWDDRAALIPVDVSDIAHGAFLVQTATILTPILALFRRSWERTEAWSVDGDTPAPPEVIRRRRAVLHFLAEGFTDDVVARRLGVGVRTVKRDVEALYYEVGATSRFQLGAAAKERGWI
jgi:DNA-binding CsgD family transcriptional regulator